jgi:hypothetical protein
MAFTRSADGVAKKGKTVGKNLGDDGKKTGAQSGPAKKVGGGKSDADMLKMGRGLAKAAASLRG